MSIGEQLHRLSREIDERAVASGREPSSVRLVAVSKTRSLAEVEAAIQAGMHDFGENTLQDALTKIPLIENSEVSWHFIGHLQSKKAAQVAEHFDWIHSVDSMKLVDRLSAALESKSKAMDALIQMNLSGEESKHGLSEDQIDGFLEQSLSKQTTALRWRGLMTMGVRSDMTRTRDVFGRLRQLRDELADRYALDSFDQLSMGMSGDYGVAIEEGATIVRVGTSIFGQRDR